LISDNLWVEETLKKLNLVKDMNQSNGFTRLGFSKEENEAKKEFQSIAKDLNLMTHEDAAGNCWALWEVDKAVPIVAMGSHLDTVYNGGGYDGVVGVLSALTAVKRLKDKGFKPKKNIAIIVFSCEESARFGISTVGSKALTGLLDKNEVANITDENGISVREAVNQSGLNWGKIEKASLDAEKIEQFIEVHIEQGKKLINNKKEIGIVHRIARPTRFIINCEGLTNHTGTTEMKDRQDALTAISPLINGIEKTTNQINEKNASSLVATVSTFSVKPNAMNMIPGKVSLGIDIRSTDSSLKNELVDYIRSFVEKVKRSRNVAIKVNKIADDLPVELNEKIQENLFNSCNKVGFSNMKMNSGAGHDVMNMSHICASGLLFIPCTEGISHNPREYTSVSNILKGTKVLEQYLEDNF